MRIDKNAVWLNRSLIYSLKVKEPDLPFCHRNYSPTVLFETIGKSG